MQLHLAVLGCDPSQVISPKPKSNEKIDGEFGGSTPDSLSGKKVASVSQGSRGSPQSPKPGLSAQVTMFSVPFSLRQRDLIRRPFTGTPAHACINTMNKKIILTDFKPRDARKRIVEPCLGNN